MTISAFVIFLNILTLSYSATLPKSLIPCRKSDPKYEVCLNTAAQNFMLGMVPGIPSLKIPSFLPFELKNMKIGANNGPISLQQDYHNVKLYGLGTGLQTHIEKIDMDNLLMTMKTFNPALTLIADFQMKGQIMIIPIDGKGVANYTAVGVNGSHEIHFEKYTKNGETYLRITDYKLQFRPKHFYMELRDLFATFDPAIANNLNKLVHDSSDLLFTEIVEDFETVFADLYKGIGNRVFTSFPMRVLFPE